MRNPWVGTVAGLTITLATAACGCWATAAAARPLTDNQPPPTARAAAMLCMPKPSACGFPDATNTGVPAGTALTRVNGVVELRTPGMVYANREVHGQIHVLADNVTIEKTRVISSADYPIDLNYGDANPRGTVIRDVEINMSGQEEGKGISFDNYTATRVWFHNGLDCAHAGRNVIITNSFCDMPKLRPGSDAHADGFQSDGGGNYVFHHNTIRNPNSQTAAILMSTNTSPIRDVVINNNLMSGGGYTVYCGTTEGGVVPNLTYTNNVISKEFFRRGGYWGATTDCDHVARSGNNVWDGEYVPPPSATPPTPGSSARNRLSIRRAKALVRAALARELKKRFTRRVRPGHMKCRHATSRRVSCNVRWRVKKKASPGFRRYRGKVVIRRISASNRRYALRIRGWAPGCQCVRVVKRTGRL